MSQFLHKGLIIRWETDKLDWEFTKLWATASRTRFIPLIDGDRATEGQPFPYCLFSVEAGEVLGRMSGTSDDPVNLKWHTREVPVFFTVFAQPTSGDSRDAKTIAADLALKIMASFGGHPDPAAQGSPGGIPLDYGQVLQLSYQDDYGVSMDDDVYQWNVNYNALLDFPVAV